MPLLRTPTTEIEYLDEGPSDGVPVLLKASSAAAWSKVVALAGFCGLSWGGLFTGYADNNHFYLKRV